MKRSNITECNKIVKQIESLEDQYKKLLDLNCLRVPTYSGSLIMDIPIHEGCISNDYVELGRKFIDDLKTITSKEIQQLDDKLEKL